MSDHMTGWILLSAIGVLLVVGGFHAGVNVGAELGGAIRSLQQFLAAPL